ncbi:MAG TPA: folate-binding protein, partial [Sphingobium sp.]|nr:folate-binding protein [Sphingobium sp.]
MPETTPSSSATWLSDRAVIRIGGAEARAFLNGLVTHDVLTLAEGQPRWAGLLSPQGKALFDFLLWADGPEDVLIDCEAAAAEALVRRLSLYRLRRPVTIARDESLAVHWAPDALDGPADPRLDALGFRRLTPAHGTDASSAWRAHRHALGVTEGAAELGSDQTLWLETNARELNGVDFAKGCYVGQENTARMHYRQKVNRRLVILPTALSDPARRRLELPNEGLAIDLRRVEDLA